MIPRAAIDQRVREWGLRHDVVEKDYVLGWLLSARYPVHSRRDVTPAALLHDPG